MAPDDTAGWGSWAAADPVAAGQPTDVALYGPDIATERELRLLGDLRGKRVVELGCGGARSAVAFARQGAIAIGVDASAEQLARTKALAAREGVRVELHHGDLADLAFLRADSVDLVFSAYALGYLDDVGRVFRQVHRVLRVGAPLVFSLEHPARHLFAPGEDGRPRLARSYFDPTPPAGRGGGQELTAHPHRVGELLTALVRASYRVDVVVEPPPLPRGPTGRHWDDSMHLVPSTLIVRARKEGN